MRTDKPETVAVQNYITAILIFLVVEMLLTWGFYGTSLACIIPVLRATRWLTPN
jgi:hypothetical protein